MRQSEVTRRTGASRDELRYFEDKGYVRPGKVRLKKRVVRDYSESDVRLIELIMKYKAKRLILDAAYDQAKRELTQPGLF